MMGVGVKPNKGGSSVTALVKLIRRIDEYGEWKKAVFIRDRFACQQCGARNGRKRIIEAHHLTSFARLVRELGITSVDAAKTCPLLWDVDNGQTLCKTCHQQTGSYPKQFVKPVKKNEKKKTIKRGKTSNCRSLHFR